MTAFWRGFVKGLIVRLPNSRSIEDSYASGHISIDEFLSLLEEHEKEIDGWIVGANTLVLVGGPLFLVLLSLLF